MRYLFLTYYTKPDGKIDESMELSKRVRTRNLQMANVILDFKELKVIKCSMGDAQVPKDWDRIVSYYFQHYAAIIERLFDENGHKIVKSKPQAHPAAEVADEKQDNPN
jgi:hypothetical protein